MFFLRQGATHKVPIGPAVAVGDGFTPVTTLALTTADEAEALVHDSSTVVDISAYTFAAVTTADGYYVLTLQSGISGTVGHMTVIVNDDSLILPIRAEFTVLEEAVYDAMFAASATGVPAAGALEATAQSILTDTGTTLQAELDAIEAAVITNAAGVDIAADIIALKAETAAILVDTGTTLQGELDAIEAAVITNAAGTDIAADIIALKAETAAILVDTGTTLDGRIPAALIGGRMDASVGAFATGQGPRFRKNVAAAGFTFPMTDSTTHAPATGLTVAVTRSIDGGAFAAGTLSAVTEVGVGVYSVDFGAGDLNGNHVMLRATATASDDRLILIATNP